MPLTTSLASDGGDHFRSSAVYLTAAHPKMTEGSDYFVGTSIDQLYAQKFGQDTPLPSIQLCIEMVDASGACDYGYACVYADTISWASPTEPLPMTLDPRMAFENLFGEGGSPEAVHTLNGTATAVGRTIIALIENRQEADGSFSLPKTLHRFGAPDRIPTQ